MKKLKNDCQENKLKTFVYYFQSDSGDSYLNQAKSEKPFTVAEAIEYFVWDDFHEWVSRGYSPEEIPYCEFMYIEVEN